MERMKKSKAIDIYHINEGTGRPYLENIILVYFVV